MKIIVNSDVEVVKDVRERLRVNNGYCPCMIEKNEDTKCICADFIENVDKGQFCHCGLYYKVEK